MHLSRPTAALLGALSLASTVIPTIGQFGFLFTYYKQGSNCGAVYSGGSSQGGMYVTQDTVDQTTS